MVIYRVIDPTTIDINVSSDRIEEKSDPYNRVKAIYVRKVLELIELSDREQEEEE